MLLTYVTFLFFADVGTTIDVGVYVGVTVTTGAGV